MVEALKHFLYLLITYFSLVLSLFSEIDAMQKYGFYNLGEI